MPVEQHTRWKCGACPATVEEVGLLCIGDPPVGWMFVMRPGRVFDSRMVLCTACIRRLFDDKVFADAPAL
jgi:hypothetical protein